MKFGAGSIAFTGVRWAEGGFQHQEEDLPIVFPPQSLVGVRETDFRTARLQEWLGPPALFLPPSGEDRNRADWPCA